MRRAVRWWLLGLLLCVPQAEARSHHSHDASVGSAIAVAELPPEASDTLQLIKRGGPFPYPRDGVAFGNYEHALPPAPRGHYREYTVKTPGARDRGARRIVCGAVPARGRPMGSPVKGTPPDTPPPGGLGAAPLLRSDPFALPECYYTDDHYRSFRRIKE
ncbi:MAG: ribonuclease domain-containing protein [Sideroxydans sp.]|nr:ribonuclease domain-containing protein [Sideroxyarcus sp.]